MVRGRNKAARTVKYRNAKRKKMKQREVSGGNTIEDIGKKNVDHGLVTSTSTNDESLRNDTRIKSNSGVSDRSMLSTEEDDDISDVSSSSSSNSEDDPDEKQDEQYRREQYRIEPRIAAESSPRLGVEVPQIFRVLAIEERRRTWIGAQRR